MQALRFFVLIDKYFYICSSPFISDFGTLATPYQRVDMRRKKLRVVNVRARRPLERKWPPNRQILLESFLDYTLPFATVDHSPTK
ncbi:uncharacterized protein PgNI_12504 [Pyricularia grisea]|uniref:Uncharacterized protein n=1 Tax=Pyricularia grisea TaxID=148305 RepID=A0A6P8AM74_PYRGI|nr:uncharacterized protein PgNI_12504 [Pyricularia grisea]TLD03140.1 hypothetical protein PgNI_12504 [Pyricularia grisea]